MKPEWKLNVESDCCGKLKEKVIDEKKSLGKDGGKKSRKSGDVVVLIVIEFFGCVSELK